MTMTAQPGPMPMPEDFQFTWREPGHSQFHWFWDQLHHPHPVTPMTASIDARAFTNGIGKVMRTLEMPRQTILTETINGYWFHTALPVSTDPAVMEAQIGRMQAELMKRAPTIQKDWETVILPEVSRLNQKLRDHPYAQNKAVEIAQFLDEVRADRERQWELHFLAVIPVMGCAFAFASVYEEMFGAPADNEHYRMLQGFPNKSVEAGQALYDIVQETPPEIRELLAATPVQGVRRALSASPAGQAFSAKLEEYLDNYGWRGDNFELANPSWREEPSPMLHSVRGLARDGAIDPRDEQARVVQERESLVAEMMERAPDEAARGQLSMLLGVAQQYLPVQEDHNFYIDQMNTVLLRLPLLELGRRLAVDGTLDGAGDIFYLTVEEAQHAARRSDPKWKATVGERKAAQEHWRRVIPPMFIGTPPPPDTPGDPMLERFFGLGLEPSKEPRVIKGHGASKGLVTGRAKIVRHLDESDKLEPGDILVCEMTMPSWTPLFSFIGGVVADSGGVLSHCAIVAREYRMPCVVGTINGTQRIKDGQLLTVDGGKGLVRIED